MGELCVKCKGTKHLRVLSGTGEGARWVHRPCECVLRDRVKMFLGPFVNGTPVRTTPLLASKSSNIFCGKVSLDVARDHIAGFLISMGTQFRYKSVDIPTLAKIYVGDGGEDRVTEEELYSALNLLLVLLNLSSVRSTKADSLLSRGLQYMSFVGKPCWVFYSGNREDFAREYPTSSDLILEYPEVELSESGGKVVGKRNLSSYGL